MSKQNFKKPEPVVSNRYYAYLIPAPASKHESLKTSIAELREKLKGQAEFHIMDRNWPEWSGQVTHIAWVDAGSLEFLSAAHQGFNQMRNPKPDVVYCADAHHTAEGKKPVRIPWITRIGHAITQLITPLKTGHTESGIFYADVETAQRIKEQQTIVSHSIGRDFAYRSRLHGFNIGYFGMNVQSKQAPKVSIPKVLSSAVLNRIYWFITQPLSALRHKIKTESQPLYRLIFGLLVMLCSIGMPVLSFQYSITWDEFEDVQYFNEVYAYFTSFGEDKRCLDVAGTMDHSESGVKKDLIPHLVNYGPFVNLLCAFVYDTISPFGLYETRHLIVALFGVFGLIFTGLTARKLGNWKTGVIAFLFMLFTPAIFGHSMNNQKDIPFLAFYIASVYYILRFMDEAPQFRFKTLFMLAVTMGITMSIRVGGLLVFAYLGLFAALVFLWKVRNKELSFNLASIRSFALPMILVYFFAYLIGIMFWPAAIQDPINHPLSALKNFEKFSLVHIYEIFEGQRYYMKDFPWYYIPKSMLITIPLFVISGVAISILASPWLSKKFDFKKLIVLLFVSSFPVAYVIYKESAVYSSWRHLLFAYPALVVLAAAGWDWVTETLPMKWAKITAALIPAVLLANVGYWMIKNHPFQYVYYNEIAGGLKGAYGNYETDYWCQSPRAAMEWLLENEPDIKKRKTTIISNNESHSMSYYAQKQTDSVEIAWARDHEWNKNDWDYAIWTTRTLSKTQMLNGYFPPKGTIHVIEADGIPLAAIVKRTHRQLAQIDPLIRSGQFDSVVKLAQEYIQYDPKEEEAWRQLGLAKLQSGKPAESIAPLYKSIELCPENYYSWNFLGYAYRNFNNTDSAIICYNLSIKHKENMSSAYDGRGDLFFTKGDFRSAKADYEQALTFGGANPMTMYKIGEANFNLNDMNEALKYFGAAIQYNPNMAEAHMRIGQILEKQGNAQAAQQYYQKARELGMR